MDFLSDKREERFCEYIAAGGRGANASYQAAFRDDCGLERIADVECRKCVDGLLAREEIKGRIEAIRRSIKGAGRLTKEMAEAMFEEKFMESMRNIGTSEKDKLNIARTQMAYYEAVKKSKGWDKEVGNDVVSITMNRVFPAGYEAKAGEKSAVKMEIKLNEEEKEDESSGVSVSLVKREKKIVEKVRKDEDED